MTPGGWLSPALACARCLLLQGTARLTCVEGCECEPQEINAHDPSERVSIEATHVVNVTQAERCLVEIRVVKNTTSTEHKFKLLGLGVRAPGDALEGRMALGGVVWRPDEWAKGMSDRGVGPGAFASVIGGASPPPPGPWGAPCRHNKRCNQPGEVDE